MNKTFAILLLLSTPVWASNHFGPCLPRETGKKVTMCDGHDQTVCVSQKLLDRKMARGWTLGKCQNPQYCGDGFCDIATGEECSNCPSDCAAFTVCCINSMGGTTTESCCSDCLLGEQCIEQAKSSGPGGGCVPN